MRNVFIDEKPTFKRPHIAYTSSYDILVWLTLLRFLNWASWGKEKKLIDA